MSRVMTVVVDTVYVSRSTGEVTKIAPTKGEAENWEGVLVRYRRRTQDFWITRGNISVTAGGFEGVLEEFRVQAKRCAPKKIKWRSVIEVDSFDGPIEVSRYYLGPILRLSRGDHRKHTRRIVRQWDEEHGRAQSIPNNTDLILPYDEEVFQALLLLAKLKDKLDARICRLLSGKRRKMIHHVELLRMLRAAFESLEGLK